MLMKILLLIVVIVFAWFGWRWVKRVQAIGRKKPAGMDRANAAPGAAAEAAPRRAQGGKSAEDMEKCAECGAYVAPRLAWPCGRPGCPYG